MATPLTDSINALTTYANSVTGTSDTTLSDAVYTLAQGYGQGGASNVSDLLKARFEEEGYVFTDFTVDSVWDGYAEIPHSLGAVPTSVIAFKKEFEYQSSDTSYQLGYVADSNFGQDNNSNRTYLLSSGNVSIANITFLDVIKNTPFIPLCARRTAWNFTSTATSETVSLRNQSTNASTLMATGEWWLGVK